MAEKSLKLPGYEDYMIDNPLALVFEGAPQLIRGARSFRKKYGRSHRGVLFGAVALLGNGSETKTFGGFNFSPVEGMQKFCAEMRAIGKGTSEGFTRQYAVIVAGPTDPAVAESVNGTSSPIPHPCHPCPDCRHLLAGSALVLTVGGEAREDNRDDIYEAHTGQQLREIYDSPQSSAKGRRRRRMSSVVPDINPVFDPNFNLLTSKRGEYLELSHELPRDLSENELRLAQAELAVRVILGDGVLEQL
jgi:hypothetical protein